MFQLTQLSVSPAITMAGFIVLVSPAITMAGFIGGFIFISKPSKLLTP